MIKKKIQSIHPGEILLEDFLIPMGASKHRLAKDINVPARRINEIVHGIRGTSPDNSQRLSRYFELSERFWINLQSRRDLDIEKDRLGGRLVKDLKVYALVQ